VARGWQSGRQVSRRRQDAGKPPLSYGTWYLLPLTVQGPRREVWRKGYTECFASTRSLAWRRPPALLRCAKRCGTFAALWAARTNSGRARAAPGSGVEPRASRRHRLKRKHLDSDRRFARRRDDQLDGNAWVDCTRKCSTWVGLPRISANNRRRPRNSTSTNHAPSILAGLAGGYRPQWHISR